MQGNWLIGAGSALQHGTVADDAKVRVVVGDDHPMYRRSLRSAIEDHPDLDLVGDAADGNQALDRVREFEPDVALLDLRMPGLDGFEVLAALREDQRSPRVLFLSAFGDSATVHRALEAGASGFLSKDAEESEICEAILAVARDSQIVVSPQLQQAVFDRIRQQASGNRLSAREKQILAGVAAGQSFAAIGEELSLSPATVKTYLHRAYEKLGVSDRAAAVAKAFQQGIL
ncbi:MAG: response regulator transcription factor [Solirubrobacteraceae bacterium MAG38_C4-C5]|nr:response regulator transcription factor [Candidatus Siliceabacter maunaloa]